MNIIIDKNLIYSPISKLVGITEKRSLMPILSNILIEFGKDNIKLYSTDLELSAITKINYQTDEEKRFVVHGKKFLSVKAWAPFSIFRSPH